MKQLLVYSFLLVALLAPCGCLAQISFSPYSTHATGSWPAVVAIGDVNNDGLNDVVLATSFYFDPVNDYKLFVFLQDASGHLLNPVKYSYYGTNTNGVNSISIADLNNDSRNDIVIGYGDSIGVFFQNAASTLNPVTTYRSGNSVAGLNTGDLNHDGLADIAVFHNSDSLRVFYQTATGFTSHAYGASTGGQTYFSALTILDINSDGLNDVVYSTNQPGNGLHTYIQNTSGLLNNYSSYTLASPPFANNGASAAGDLNNDGKNDAAVSGYGNRPTSEVVLRFQNPSTALLGIPLQLPAYDCPEPTAIADLNCDGKNEIILCHGGWNHFSVYEQDASGNYGNYTLFPVSYASHYDAQGMAIGDINNDGMKDVVIADYNNGLLTLLNTSSSTPITVTTVGSNTICQGSSVTLNANGASTFTWSPSTGLNTTTGTSVIATPVATTVYTVKSTNTCGTLVTETITVTVDPYPIPTLNSMDTICSGSLATLTAGGGTNYSWNTGATSASITVTPLTQMTYSVSVSNGVCAMDTSITVFVKPAPVTTCGKDTTVFFGNSAHLQAGGGISYFWNPALNLSCTTCPDPVATPNSTTTYFVTITGANGCSLTKPITVTVDENLELFVPDIFSPNGDGKNDVLFVRGSGIKEMSFTVYDRLGELIFSTTNAAQGWDGTYKGAVLNTGVFVYYLTATLQSGNQIHTKGDVTLIR